MHNIVISQSYEKKEHEPILSLTKLYSTVHTVLYCTMQYSASVQYSCSGCWWLRGDGQVCADRMMNGCSREHKLCVQSTVRIYCTVTYCSGRAMEKCVIRIPQLLALSQSSATIALPSVLLYALPVAPGTTVVCRRASGRRPMSTWPTLCAKPRTRAQHTTKLTVCTGRTT